MRVVEHMFQTTCSFRGPRTPGGEMRRHPAGLLLTDQVMLKGTIRICSGSRDNRSEVLNTSCLDMIERQMRAFQFACHPQPLI